MSSLRDHHVVRTNVDPKCRTEGACQRERDRVSLSEGACRRDLVRRRVSEGARQREIVRGSLSDGGRERGQTSTRRARQFSPGGPQAETNFTYTEKLEEARAENHNFVILGYATQRIRVN